MTDSLKVKKRKINNYCDYLAGDDGKIYSVKFGREKVLKHWVNRYGYPCVRLSKNSVVKQYTVHSLIAASFLNKIDGETEVNHINGIKTDNRLENLEWVTHKRNMQHIFHDIGNQFKLSKHDIPKIRVLINSGKTLTAIAKDYSVSLSTISNIKRGRVWVGI